MEGFLILEWIYNILFVLTAVYSLIIVLFLIGLRKPKYGNNAEKLTVTVIIAARNEQDTIPHILSDLTQQSYPFDLFEVIVVNDHSTDDTEKVITKFSQQHPNIKLYSVDDIPENYSPKKYAIQCAVEQAQGEIILATDADCRVGPDWIASMVSYFEPHIGFVIGFSQFGKKGEKQNFIGHYQAFDFIELMSAAAATTNLGVPLAASGQNLGYRKSAFTQVGGYSRVAGRVSGDDVLLLQLVRKYTDYKIVFASDARAYASSSPQPTVSAFINQRKRWASNGSIQIKLNFVFFLYLVIVFLFNLSLFLGLLGGVLAGDLYPFISCMLIRAVFEFVLGVVGTAYFNRKDLLRYFFPWFVSQIPYILWTGAMGSLGKFNWKERLHAAKVGVVK